MNGIRNILKMARFLEKHHEDNKRKKRKTHVQGEVEIIIIIKIIIKKEQMESKSVK